MLRHGLLSPHSKLLPESSANTGSSRPGSVFSTVSSAFILFINYAYINDFCRWFDDDEVRPIQRSAGYSPKTCETQRWEAAESWNGVDHWFGMV